MAASKPRARRSTRKGSATEADDAPTIIWGAEEIDSDSEEVGWTAEDEGKTVWKPPVDARAAAGYRLTPEQVAFKRTIDVKFYIGTAVYFIVALGGAYASASSSPPPDDVLAAAATSASPRLQLTAACASFTLYWILRSVIFDAPPEPTDDSWSFLQACPAGRFVWLTVNIDAAQLVYWSLCLLVETEALLTLPQMQGSATAVALHWGLLSALHSGAVFVWSLSFMLGALFLKFCW
eukprot:COSAG02_NODE_1773_length_10980_cov_8.196765_14_plen_236_part_00